MVGLSQTPSRREDQGRRELGGVSLGRARVDPGHQRLPLAVRQAARLEELAEPGGGLPWRHHAALDGIANVVPLVVRITIGDQRERRVLPGAVTGLAARL